MPRTFYKSYIWLDGCKEIRGHGLASSHSWFASLETVNLYGTCAIQNLTPFLWILQTLVPFKFCNLQVKYSLIRHPELVDFMRKLQESKLEQAHQSRAIPVWSHWSIRRNKSFPTCLELTTCFVPPVMYPFARNRAALQVCANAITAAGESHCNSCYKSTGRTVIQCGFCGRSHCNTDMCGGGFKIFVCVSCPNTVATIVNASWFLAASYCLQETPHFHGLSGI